MKKLVIIFYSLLICSGCSNKLQPHSTDPLILPGIGYDNLIIGKSSIYDVLLKYGDDYKFEHGITDLADGTAIHQYRYIYKSLGLKFEADIEDPISESSKNYILESISFKHPFKGATKENIILNETKKEELIKMMGSNYKIIEATKRDEKLVYKESGVLFLVNRETNIVEEIMVFKPYR